jgi:large subunit ribosomal protein L33
VAEDGPRIEILLRSSAGAGTVPATTKNRRTTSTKLQLRAFDPVIRRHAPFHEILA